MRKLVLAVGLVLGSASFALPVHAQSLLVTGDEGTDDTPAADTETDTSSSASNTDSGSSSSSVLTTTGGSTNPFLSSGGSITPPQIGGGDRTAVETPAPRDKLPKSPEEMVSPENLGMTPQEYAEAVKNVEKQAILHPDTVMDDPIFQIEMLKTGQQISKAMDKRVRESCNTSAFTVRFDVDGWTPAARDAVKTKAVGTLASAIDSLCRDPEQKDKVMSNLYAISIKNVLGSGSPKVSYEDGTFILSGDFSQISDDFTVPAVKSQIVSAAQKDAEHLEKMKPQIEAISKNYSDSTKDEKSKKQ